MIATTLKSAGTGPMPGYSPMARDKTGRGSLLCQQSQVLIGDHLARALGENVSLFQEECAIAELRDDHRVVRDEENRVTSRAQLAMTLHATRLESGITDREDLVENQDLTHGLEGDRVGEAGGHAARIVHELQVG